MIIIVFMLKWNYSLNNLIYCSIIATISIVDILSKMISILIAIIIDVIVIAIVLG